MKIKLLNYFFYLIIIKSKDAQRYSFTINCKGEKKNILTGNPESDIFKKTFKRYTNFAFSNLLDKEFKGTTKFGNRVECKLDKVGDLIHKINLNLKIPTSPGVSKKRDGVLRWVDNIGFAMIDRIELMIGEKLIDYRTGEWLYLWSELSSKNYAKYMGVQNMTGNIAGVVVNKTIEELYQLTLHMKILVGII